MIGKEAVTAWVEGYRAAWTSNDPDAIAALFTDDAVYEFRPNDPEPWRGRDAIVSGWLAERDAPETWRFDFTVLGVMPRDAVNELGMAVTPDATAVVQGVTEYLDDRPTYENLWLITLRDDGRASHFTEWFMVRKGTDGTEAT
jgi:ketosteroid isomerase-like protein